MRGGRPTLLALVALIATMLSGALALSGTAAIAVALAVQQEAPRPPRSAAGTLGPAALPAGFTGAASDGPASDGAGSDEIPQVIGPVLPRSRPVEIHIPEIGVRSPLHALGMTAERTLQVPSGSRFDEAAWYERSVTPGARGPAVILGHVDSPRRGPSVFYRLGALRQGDRILVTRADGLVAVFKVDGVRPYPKDKFPARLVYGETPHAALRLITCGGTFDRATGHYRDNLVVFASLEGTQPRVSRRALG